jgi:hypothetical protein
MCFVWIPKQTAIISLYGISWFVGAFAKLRKATIRFMSVRLSAWNNSAPTGWIFHED